MDKHKLTKILFVCHGNICRSPMAEFIMKELVRQAGREDEFLIRSAAVSYEEQGNGLYHSAAAKLREKNVPFGNHRAHRISASEATDYDLIVIMDRSNKHLLQNIINKEDYPKIRYCLEFAGRYGESVADPWYSGDFERAYQDILAGCQGLLKEY